MFRLRADGMAGVLEGFESRCHQIGLGIAKRLVATIVWLAIAAQLAAGAGDPAVPAGVDPGGGMRVAILGRGIDYTADDIHGRLARDGEGEIIGHDFIDDDRQPYAAAGDTDIARVILAEGQATTLVPVRTNFGSVSTLALSLGFVVKGPARIVVLLHPFDGENFVSLLRAVAPRFPDRLFIVEAGNEGLDLDPLTEADARGMANVLVVTASDRDGRLAGHVNFGALSVDIAVPTSDAENPAAGSRPVTTALAAARVAALAARLMAVDRQRDGRGLKERIAGLGTPMPDAGANASRDGAARAATRSGWIKEPKRHFWLE